MVYPAGFVYLFSGLYYLTDNGTDIGHAQFLFAIFYLVHLLVVFALYEAINEEIKMPPVFLLFISLTGYRMHSIFSLRLFNDGPAMTIFYISLLLFINRRWILGSIIYSVSVSVKMNTLLAAPGILVVFMRNASFLQTVTNLAVCAIIQVLIGFEFLTTFPIAYLHRSFNFGRQFEYKWTVGWRFLSEDLFLDRRFHLVLLLMHLILLVLFFHKHWSSTKAKKASIFEAVKISILECGNDATSASETVQIILESNLIGIFCARSLHYQFYVWYYHSLPILANSTKISSVVGVLVFLSIEYCWNIYPSTIFSSLLLYMSHTYLLINLYFKNPTCRNTKVE